MLNSYKSASILTWEEISDNRFRDIGSVGGLLIGVLIIGLISNGLNLMHVNSYWQFVLKGIIIIAAVYVDMVKQKKQNAAK